MKLYRKFAALALSGVMALGIFAGCSGDANETTQPSTVSTANITVVSREEGSGTRGAFVELMGVETDEGDMTTENAEIANSTALVQTTVAGNVNAIGYISLGSYDPAAVKALQVDGVDATVENVKAGAYAVSRPFNICYREENLTELGKDFIGFIMSADGQKIIGEKYIPVDAAAAAYTPAGLTGSLSINGSTSVGPVMEQLAEAYKVLNPGVVIDVQQTGSGTGITATVDGSCEIGLSSRELKDEELAEGLTSLTIALDGIAVIVNPANPVDGLTAEQIRAIYTGEVTDWSQVG